jgi:predicted RND superfamily exporter protein
MNKIIYLILFMMLFLFSSNIFALEVEYNTESNVKKAILVEDYILRHKEKIEDFIVKYNIVNNKELTKDIKELNESIEALKKIQNTDIEKQKAEEVLQAILVRIKNVNESLKIKLKIEKEDFENKLNSKKLIYSKL